VSIRRALFAWYLCNLLELLFILNLSGLRITTYQASRERSSKIAQDRPTSANIMHISVDHARRAAGPLSLPNQSQGPERYRRQIVGCQTSKNGYQIPGVNLSKYIVRLEALIRSRNQDSLVDRAQMSFVRQIV
jgi:hypothetical protein